MTFKFLVLSVLITIPSLTQAKGSLLYNTLEDDIRKELEALVKRNHKPLSQYRQSRKFILQQVHLDKDHRGYFVRDVYCNICYRKKIGPNSMPNSNEINIEHTWPKSKFNKSQSYRHQLSDLHHLYPSDSMSNSRRGSDQFRELRNGRSVHVNCKTALTSDISSGFEPPNEHKGNVARALFYFAIRYKLKISKIEESFLRKWHTMDPVDANELNRNDLIEQIQGNRNPFVDDPDLVEMLEDF